MFRSLLLSLSLVCPLFAGIDLRLPTENHHLFTGEPEKFYMHVDRNFEGTISTPWEGGCYGYVRNSLRIQDQVIQTKFHEGIDIKPLRRDALGHPLDVISSIAEGKVVYTSATAGHSNYGRYVVVEHSWDHSAIYSLYAHLAVITCKLGDSLQAGSPIGRMGFTGSGINCTRAHLHLEVAMMLTTRYADWAKGMINHHGNFNGMNLTGADVAKFFLAHQENPELQFREFIASTPVYFKVTTPATGTPDFVKRYPWICRGDPQNAKSWEISFSATGMPIAFTPSTRLVSTPVVTAILPSDIPHQYKTRYLITGQGKHATLATQGKKLVALLMDNF